MSFCVEGTALGPAEHAGSWLDGWLPLHLLLSRFVQSLQKGLGMPVCHTLSCLLSICCSLLFINTIFMVLINSEQTHCLSILSEHR